MNMAPSAPDKTQLCAQQHRKYRAGSESKSIRILFLTNQGMADHDDFRLENDTNYPSSMEPDDSWLHLRLGGSDHPCTTLQSTPPRAPQQSLAPNIKRSVVPKEPNLFAKPYGSNAVGLNCAVSGGGGMRIIRPPRRPNVGVWFMLQASQNQVVEPILPQIPRSNLRIKHGRMTVRLLKKYLAHKLRLGSESEVEIKCRGEVLPSVLTMQYVRDNIWSVGREDASLLALMTNSSSLSSSAAATESLLMILHYARTISAPDDEN